MRRIGWRLLHAASRGMTCSKRNVSMPDATRASVLLCRVVFGSRNRTCTFCRTSCGASTMIDRTCEASALARNIGCREPKGMDKGEAIRYTYPSWGEDAMCAHHGHNARVEVFADPHVESLRVVLKHLAREPLRAPRI